MRFIAWITAACAISVGATFLILGLGPFAGGVWIAVAAAVVLIAELVNAIRKDRDDKLRRGREAEWQRREQQGEVTGPARDEAALELLKRDPDAYFAQHRRPWPLFADMKPWPIGDDEVRR